MALSGNRLYPAIAISVPTNQPHEMFNVYYNYSYLKTLQKLAPRKNCRHLLRGWKAWDTAAAFKVVSETHLRLAGIVAANQGPLQDQWADSESTGRWHSGNRG